MNSDAVRVRRSGRRALLATVIGMAALGQTATSVAEERTWRTVDELTAEERALYDPNPAAPRAAALPYIPAEPYPFEPPYTAEEMGYRSSEFVHISRWPYSMIDVFGVLTSSGYINQGAWVTYILPTSGPGFEGYLTGVKAGEPYARWMIYSTFPPETEAEQQLWVLYRTDGKFTTKMDYFIYSPTLRRVRRQPQPRRDQRFPDNAQTFDDVIGRDPWELEWSLLGTDVLYETMRFPNVRPTITLNVPGKGFVERKTGGIKPMGDGYPHYRADGGVACWVVKGIVRKEVMPDYNEKALIFWLDKHSFYPLRVEKYDHQDQLMMVEERKAELQNPARGERGYAAMMTIYWDLPHDILSYSVHDAHRAHEWSAEERDMLFTPEFMRRQWLYEPIKTQALMKDPEQSFMRPPLYPDKFPAARKIVMYPELEARVRAQEAAGHVVFESPGDDTPSAKAE